MHLTSAYLSSEIGAIESNLSVASTAQPLAFGGNASAGACHQAVPLDDQQLGAIRRLVQPAWLGTHVLVVVGGGRGRSCPYAC